MELLQRAPDRIQRLLVQEQVKLGPELSALIQQSKVKTKQLSRDELERLTNEGVHQGIAAELSGTTEVELDELIRLVEEKGDAAVLVILDEVQDPHNVGAAFRAAEAFGAVGMILTDRRSADVTPVARKASAGATELLPWAKAPNLQRAIRELKAAGIWIIGTDCEPGARTLPGVDLPRPMALIFGSEGRGIRELTKKESDVLLTIPLHGTIDSLNLSQAVSVVLYEVTKKK